MKLKVYVQCSDACFPFDYKDGDLIDLKAGEDTTLKSGEYKLVPLEVRIQLPKGFKANVYPRSSTFNKYKIVMVNSVGQIDCTYCGPDDEWKFPAYAIEDTNISKGNRICQFDIFPSMKATVFQKLKWLFSNGVKLIRVDKLNNKNRNGFGSSGN